MSSARLPSTDRPAEPFAVGVLATAKQSFGDVWKQWPQRTEIADEEGRVQTVWRQPTLSNPWSQFRMLNWKAWCHFIVGFICWTADAYDFHALTINTTQIAAHFDCSNTVISTAITLTLLLRSVGAVIFGLPGDRWGCIIPLVFNLVVLGALQIGTIYANSLGTFFAVRSLFGLFMGGVFGNAASTAMENCPPEARGLVSGIFQQGYSFGFVLAACMSLSFKNRPESWKSALYVGTGFSVLAGVLASFLLKGERRELKSKRSGRELPSLSDFWKKTKTMLKSSWRNFFFCVFFMTFFNYFSHTSQDSYTTFMIESKGLARGAALHASIWMKTGACVGGPIHGWFSQWFGRRRTIMQASLCAACCIVGWILPKSETVLSITGFMIQFFIQGAWGVIPVHLNELAPPAFRSTFPGLTYQLGNALSSPSTQIVNAIAERVYVKDARGPHVKGYGPVMGVATAIIATGIFLIAMVGPERRGRNFDEELPAGADFDSGAARERDVESGPRGGSSDKGITVMEMEETKR
ncbi:major facilitator superfamily domain-containing protein [Calycina marina]|uniref:Major facilitator superfamily domain-containing protein n=1 Tax=Calycina marina TaxID=1763456 RepID=A0A9P7Z2B6_9HELO|nr:major facilitator superfamily domain-containing protein [Calycina marina]